MTETSNHKLPLIAAAQAQKHVTLNEALTRVDAALQLSAVSRTLGAPPPATEGQAYLVPEGASDAWSGQDGRLAFSVGGGWDFLTPKPGWRIWIADEAVTACFDGTLWAENIMASSPARASMRAQVIERDVTLDGAGIVVDTAPIIPAGSSVFAITGRVLQGFDGGVTSWSLGVGGGVDRYGTGFGITTGAWLRGLTGQPQAYYSDTALRLSATGGDFGSGVVRLAVHAMVFDLPDGT